MSDFGNYPNRMAGRGAAASTAVDEGLRAYMLKVYNLMALGLAITGVAAFATFQMAVSSPAFAQAIYNSPLRWVVILAPVAMVFFLSFRIHKMSVSAAQTTFWVYAALMGLSLSSIFLVYTGQSIVQTFFITAASFGALSLYGYTTKRSLSAMGSFLVMGLFGLIIASIVNMFLASSALAFAISAIGVLVFAGLTAYDTQRIKESYYEADDAATTGRKAIIGALQLYLDFVNLFLFMLRFLGNRN
ncbi:Bax inhibitor-1/YccA family protein [Rhizobium halophytocola]|uniref:FtsH-binding integral membrane protein n=1 Tax=Rhizobium halophytocola TaxID=735519 RepID=A0ABS4E2W7_9HYPH|nr:Bax inhibitor-1/YccA family protein [Rhizobium halophytocola]MBP1852290.1 FtsH-binding integral membrane protein [Rhizobium halophytocola]